MAKKYYGVKAGRQVGVYCSWDECQEQINGYSSAVFRSFSTREEAEQYVYGEQFQECSFSFPVDNQYLHLYTDGSFNSVTNEYGMGYVLVKDGEIVRIGCRKGDSADCVSSRNIAGEIGAVELGLMEVQKVYETKYPVVIHYDYEGIGMWAEKSWKANKGFTQTYIRYIENLRSEGMKLSFEHVKGHSGNHGNELADVLARHSLGMSSTSEQNMVQNMMQDAG